MSRLQRLRSQASGLINNWELEGIFFVFGLIYIPVSALYLNQGTLAYVLLALYTFILIVLGIMLLSRFVITLAKHANEHSGEFGTIFAAYMSQVFIVLVIAKVVAYVILQMLPPTHTGIVCSIVWFLKDLFAIFKVQTVLSHAIVVSAAVMLTLALTSVWFRRKDK